VLVTVFDLGRQRSRNHYNYFRDYDPSIGRYIQSDPIGLKAGLNTYLYVDATPLQKVDPLSLTTKGNCWAPELKVTPDCSCLSGSSYTECVTCGYCYWPNPFGTNCLIPDPKRFYRVCKSSCTLNPQPNYA
jgi:RHS repeat-associated protein